MGVQKGENKMNKERGYFWICDLSRKEWENIYPSNFYEIKNYTKIRVIDRMNWASLKFDKFFEAHIKGFVTEVIDNEMTLDDMVKLKNAYAGTQSHSDLVEAITKDILESIGEGYNQHDHD